MVRDTLAAALLSLGLAAGAQASPPAVFVNFEAGPLGLQPQGFTPNVPAGVPAPFLTVSTNNGGDALVVGDFGAQGDGLALKVGDVFVGDFDSDFLVLGFSTRIGPVGLSFGNDSAACTAPGDLAVLTAFLGAAQVGEASVAIERNDIMDQTIALTGGPFDRVTSAFTDAFGSPFTGPGALGGGLVEIVDNLSYFGFDRVPAVPAPGVVALFAAGLLGLAASRRRRRA